jgi:predicted dehydrogenase
MFPTIYGTKGSIKSDIVYLDDGTKKSVNQLFDENALPGIKEKFFPFGLTDAAALETLDFLNAIFEGRDSEISGKEGLKDLAVAFAIIESSFLERSLLVEDIKIGKTSFYESDINKIYGL